MIQLTGKNCTMFPSLSYQLFTATVHNDWLAQRSAVQGSEKLVGELVG
jgi:hypothetical protein